MSEMTRRDFIAAGAAITGAALAAGNIHAQYGEPMLGCQSYSFRNFDFQGSIEQLRKLDLSVMEFCAVHFPPNANDPGFAAIKKALDLGGIQVPAYGVEGFGGDAAANRVKFEFGKALGVQILSADPSPDAFDNLDALVEEFGIKIGIHNHGPGARYDGVKDTLDAVKNHNKMIGACLDTGHCIRSNEKPHEVAEALGERLHALHLKDWIHGGEEQIVGEGDLDLLALAKVLKGMNFTGPVVLEYENHPDNPVPDMAKGIANVIAAWEAA